MIVYVDEPPAASAFYVDTFGLQLGVRRPPTAPTPNSTPARRKLAFASYALGEENFHGGVRRQHAGEQPTNVEITLVDRATSTPPTPTALKAGCESLSPRPRTSRTASAWRGCGIPFGTLVELATPM